MTDSSTSTAHPRASSEGAETRRRPRNEVSSIRRSRDHRYVHLTWILILSGFVVVYKLAAAASTRRAFLLSGQSAFSELLTPS
jgi:hypothetical protein